MRYVASHHGLQNKHALCAWPRRRNAVSRHGRSVRGARLHAYIRLKMPSASRRLEEKAVRNRLMTVSYEL